MSATSFVRLFAAIFAAIAILQLVRALAGWPVVVASTSVPVRASWVACIIAAALSKIGSKAPD
jgi:hypothetical protein